MGKEGGEKDARVAPAPRDPLKSRGLASENPDITSRWTRPPQLVGWTVGIRTPLSDGIVLTIGFGGRRRPDVVFGWGPDVGAFGDFLQKNPRSVALDGIAGGLEGPEDETKKRNNV